VPGFGKAPTRTSFTTSRTYGFRSSVRYAPTPRFNLSGFVHSRNATLTPRIGSGGACVTSFRKDPEEEDAARVRVTERRGALVSRDDCETRCVCPFPNDDERRFAIPRDASPVFTATGLGTVTAAIVTVRSLRWETRDEFTQDQRVLR